MKKTGIETTIKHLKFHKKKSTFVNSQKYCSILTKGVQIQTDPN